MTGVFGIGVLEKKEKRSDISMKEKYDKNHDSTILYGVPKVGYGIYGGSTPFPICNCIEEIKLLEKHSLDLIINTF